MKKALFSLFLTLLLTVCLSPAALAANDSAKDSAQILYELDLFRGTGTNPDGTPVFDLDKTPSRNQAVIMLVRLLGKEQEALAGNWDLPFTDVAKGSTPYPYIGYAYAHGLTNGTTATTYSGTAPIRANQYITFVLRAMGYVSGEDFQVSTAWELSDELGITDGQYTAANADSFIRADVAKISASALSAPLKGGEPLLAEKLMAEGVFTKAQYEAAVGKPPENTPEEPKTPPEEPGEEPFTATAFGDRWLHEYLMSLKPDGVSLDLTVFAGQNAFDTYRFEDRILFDEISAALKAHYTFARIKESNEPSYMEGTVETLSTKVEAVQNTGSSPYLSVLLEEPDGYRTRNTYYFA